MSRGVYGATRALTFVGAQLGRAHVGSSLVHMLELKQRYNNVKTGAAAALLRDLSREGAATSPASNRWEIALKNGAWVLLAWYPDHAALEITITDRELRSVDKLDSDRQRYEAILRKITPKLRSFGATTVGAAIHVGHGVHIGQGSIFGHTPTDVENELDQLHGELMCFGQEVIELTKPLDRGAREAAQNARNEELAAWKVVDSFQPLVNEVYRIEKLLNQAGVSKKLTESWREESIPPYADIVLMPTGKAEPLKQRFIAAKTALDKFMPKAQRLAAIKRARELSDQRAEHEREVLGESPLVQWTRSVWRPFFDSWQKFHSEKKDIPFQTWPLSGTWDRIQDYRKQWIDLRKNAPFKSKCPQPLDPSSRTDPSLTNIFGDVGKILKWGVIGALGIGAVVALSSVASNLRSRKDPGEKYMELIRESRRSRASRALPSSREQRALPPGEPEIA